MPLVNAVNDMDSASIELKMPAPGDRGYNEWRKTGTLPDYQEPEEPEDKKEKQEKEEVVEAVPSGAQVQEQVQEHDTGSSEEEESATSTSVNAAASETARPQKKGAESRKAQLQAEIRERANEVRELTRQAEEIRKSLAEARKPQSQTASEVKDKPEAKAKPQLGDKDANGKPLYPDWEAYQDARDAWVAEKAVRDSMAQFTEHTTKTQTEQQKAAKEAETARIKGVIADEWAGKAVKARDKYQDFDEVAFARTPDGKGYLVDIPEGSAMDQFILESDHGPDILYQLGKNYDAVKNIFERNATGAFKTSPIKQLRELFKIEQKLTAPKPAIRVSQAPAPPHQVSGKAAGPVDDVERALNDGDFAAFQAAENSRQLEKIVKARRRA